MKADVTITTLQQHLKCMYVDSNSSVRYCFTCWSHFLNPLKIPGKSRESYQTMKSALEWMQHHPLIADSGKHRGVFVDPQSTPHAWHHYHQSFYVSYRSPSLPQNRPCSYQYWQREWRKRGQWPTKNTMWDTYFNILVNNNELNFIFQKVWLNITNLPFAIIRLFLEDA